jgi:hypothetical protein
MDESREPSMLLLLLSRTLRNLMKNGLESKAAIVAAVIPDGTTAVT